MPYVKYVQLVRRAEAMRPPRESVFAVRRLEAGAGVGEARGNGITEVAAVMRAVSAWFSAARAAAVTLLAERGDIELHAAFEGERPVSVAGLMLDREDGSWAHLGWAGTDPAHRGRGAQSALIAARVSRAAALGATWCTSETNTAVPISLGNLMRCGFGPAIQWRVYEWTPRAL